MSPTENNTDNPRDSFVFYRLFHDMIKECQPKDQLRLYVAIAEYALFGIEPGFTGIINAIWMPIKDHISRNIAQYDARRDNGRKGGAPKGSRNNPAGRRGKNNQELTETNQELTEVSSELNPELTKTNLNDNVNVNDNDNVNVNDNVNWVSYFSSERFVNDFIEKEQITLEAYCMREKISVDDFRDLAITSVQEWKMQGWQARDRQDAVSYLLNKVRIKAERRRKEANSQQNGCNEDKFSRRRGTETTAQSADDFSETF